jgi:hypothetical protein
MVAQNLLLKKLQIKLDHTVAVLNAPQNFEDIIGEVPASMTIAFNATESYHALLIFSIAKADMRKALDEEFRKIDQQMICWIIYPKAKTKLASDLNLMQSWDELKDYQLTPCASAAIDSIWTALRIKPASAQKKSGIGNTEILQNEYGQYIDVENKSVILPEDLQLALAQHSTARDFYEQLSYSNRKEYVLWILTAKQEKTRIDRIHKTVDKLLSGKKNPNEK